MKHIPTVEAVRSRIIGGFAQFIYPSTEVWRLSKLSPLTIDNGNQIEIASGCFHAEHRRRHLVDLTAVIRPLEAPHGDSSKSVANSAEISRSKGFRMRSDCHYSRDWIWVHVAVG